MAAGDRWRYMGWFVFVGWVIGKEGVGVGRGGVGLGGFGEFVRGVFEVYKVEAVDTSNELERWYVSHEYELCIGYRWIVDIDGQYG